jgi:hypothetical protein
MGRARSRWRQVQGAHEGAIKVSPVYLLDESDCLRYTPGHAGTVLDAGLLVIHPHLLRLT